MSLRHPHLGTHIASVGAALLGLVLMAVGSFRAAGLTLSAGMAALFIWRLRHPRGAGWYAVRARWIDLLVILVLLIGTAVFSIVVPAN